MKSLFILWNLVLLLSAGNSLASTPPPGPMPDPMVYRQFTLKIRKAASFFVPVPTTDMHFNYQLEFGAPIYSEPKIQEFAPNPEHPERVYRFFWDRIFVKDGSHMILNGEQVPLTCIFVQGQDNRWAADPNPLFPEFLMKVMLVANDFQCVGPIRPNWPLDGGKKENWDTYIEYTVRDPTIMLPQDALLRYRWNGFHSVLLK